jgi:hypothetical protein
MSRRPRRFLGLPYDWRRPTARRMRAEIWNTDDPRLFVPKSFGWGYGVNLGAIPARLRRRR